MLKIPDWVCRSFQSSIRSSRPHSVSRTLIGSCMRLKWKFIFGILLAACAFWIFLFYESSTLVKRFSGNSSHPIDQVVTTSNTSYRIVQDTVRPTESKLPKVDIFINIPAAGHLYIRREVLRNSWLSTVKHYSVAYRFFTDGIGIKPELMSKLKKEQAEFKDLEFIPTKNGYWLTHRYLFALFWAYEHYNFTFYMKVDDDYFVCLNNLANDLQYRKHEKFLYWGHFGCERKMVAMDEGFLIISRDLAQEFIKRNSSLYCSPFGGQMIAMWINKLEHQGYDVVYFPDNSRLMHYRSYLKKEHKDICKEILGIHQAYPKHMARYWNLTKDNWFSIKSDEFVKVKRKEYKEYCSLTKEWDWRVLNPFWRKEPKPCWQPGLSWPDLEKYKEVQSREREER